MIADYYFIRKQQLDIAEMYKENGRYSFTNGFNMSAVIALLIGILLNVPGVLVQIKIISDTAFPIFSANSGNVFADVHSFLSFKITIISAASIGIGSVGTSPLPIFVTTFITSGKCDFKI